MWLLQPWSEIHLCSCYNPILGRYQHGHPRNCLSAALLTGDEYGHHPTAHSLWRNITPSTHLTRFNQWKSRWRCGSPQGPSSATSTSGVHCSQHLLPWVTMIVKINTDRLIWFRRHRSWTMDTSPTRDLDLQTNGCSRISGGAWEVRKARMTVFLQQEVSCVVHDHGCSYLWRACPQYNA
ncbi:hypothetical protein BD414DRAFT_502445 [Trametes punicea]|nr:hypothetical protein BD414DRAFT_502445 [Trametes punicea]